MILEHAGWVVFGWVLANQGGVPMPVVPVLLAAGGLAATGRISIGHVFAVAVGATLCADLAWYGLGRWRGAEVLGLLRRLSPNAKAFVRRAQDGYTAHAGTFQLTARFLPELNPVSAGLAGATGLGVTRFLGYGVVSALVWAGAWTGTGYLLGDVVVDFATRFGIRLMGFVLAALLVCLVVRRARRHRLLRTLQKARIAPDDLKARIERGERMAILDVRGADELARAPYMLPGALWITPDELPQRLRELPRDVTVVLYGRHLKRAKGERASLSSNVALWLRGAGFGRVRPLAGGLHAWCRRGYPLQAAYAGLPGNRVAVHRCPIDGPDGPVESEHRESREPMALSS